MNALPETGFLRLPHIIGDPNAEPPIPALIPICKTVWWEGVKSGRFPRPVKLGPRTTAWRVEDVRDWIEAQGLRKAEDQAPQATVEGRPSRDVAAEADADAKTLGLIAAHEAIAAKKAEAAPQESLAARLSPTTAGKGGA